MTQSLLTYRGTVHSWHCDHMGPVDQRIAYRRGDLGDLLATMVVTGVHIDAVGRRATAFDKQMHAKAETMKSPDAALWDAWPPEKAYLE
jgi:acyl-CoA thioesterase FadM